MAEFTTDQVRTVTNKAERCENISNDLNSMPLAERVQFAKAMQDMNAADRQADKHLPKLDLTFGKDSAGTEHLLDAQCVKDPSAIVMKGKTDIYDLPRKAEMLYVDSWRMAADSLDSNARFNKVQKASDEY
jgi:hypothetical protein